MRTFLFSFSLFCLFVCTTKGQTVDSIKTQKLSEVEVSAHIKPSTSRSTTPLQVISAESIIDQGLQSISDVVRRFNGIVLKDYGGVGGLKTIAIRGMGAEHTAISYDGIMVTNTQSGQVDIGRFALDNISSISLNIGQADNIFQTAKAFASVGVLNLQTVTPKLSGKKDEGKIRIKTGSFGLFNPALEYAHRLNKKSIISINGSWQRVDGQYPFEMINGKRPFKSKRNNSDVNIYRIETNLYNKLGKAGNLDIKIYYFDSERGLPGAIDFQNDYRVERLWEKNFFTQIAYNKYFNKQFKFKSQAKYDYNYTRYRDIYDAYENGARVDRYKQQEVYWSNSILYTLNNNLSLSLAEDLSYNKLKDETTKFGGNMSEPERYNSLTALATQYKTSRITVNTSLLGTYITEKIKKSEKDNTYKKLSPTVSLSFVPFSAYNQLRIRASYKDIFRIPTFTEAFYTRSLSIIKPESARQFNGGITWIGSLSGTKSNYISLSIDGYYNKVKDKIVIQPSTFYAYTTNLGEVEISGIDAKLAAGLDISNNMNIDISGSYSYMKAIDVTDPKEDSYKNQLIYTPEHSGAISAVFKNPWVNFSYSVLITGERYFWHQNIPTYKLKSYSEHSISINRQVNINKNKDILLQAGISNLWNEQYEVMKYYPMPGRSFNISANLKF
ncbi:TonB-dependent receptor plug domain-containing protein [Dysgonomonas sp. Marseille-P4677]|uniref:TonB-dependent receptor plug domain-containing protein n=1 Tax=Dysgonomonas sp. Marseille-P4677 TaxID=2364790 RepID=UPI001913FBCB|nr:TonB-dependent receptor plug domain-containing protein [Dysgonomonas sp. Marseille-P4677]MBK5720576.1 TonB-dependent receptor plug domain-containing protein [Dysgonomonas sp. Marseille-P4677]